MITLFGPSEAVAAAARAWAALTDPDNPMPTGVALDMVQDVTGDVREAARELCGAAADWLVASPPPPAPHGASKLFAAARLKAVCVAPKLRRHPWLAREEWAGVRRSAHAGVTVTGSGRSDEWRRRREAWEGLLAWIDRARRAATLCTEILFDVGVTLRIPAGDVLKEAA